METWELLHRIKEDIGGQDITDVKLRIWSGELREAVYNDENITRAVKEVLETLLHECKQANFRAGNRINAIHNKILLGRYYNLLKYFIDSLDMSNGHEIWDYCRNEIEGFTDTTDSRIEKPQQATEKPSRGRQREETDREKKYYAKALQAGMMEKTETGFQWTYNKGSKVSLAYFIKKIYNPDGLGVTHYREMETIFSVTRLDRATQQLLEVKKQQKWRGKIDELFQD